MHLQCHLQNWIETTGAIGIVCKSGRYGGTYAHSDIALNLHHGFQHRFKLYIIMDYKRLKADENSRFSLNWNLNSEISKLNYKIHTDAIKENLIPPELTPAQISFTYANEADMLNVVLFGRTTAGSIFATRNFLSQTRFTPTQKIRIEPMRERSVMAASVMTGAISLANSVTAPSNRGSLALPDFFLVKKTVEYSAGDPAGG